MERFGHSGDARQPVVPHFLLAHNWPLAFADAPAPQADAPSFLWDESVRLGVCGDSVTPSRVDEVHRSDLPLSCPLPSMALWNSHPRVYLPIEDEPNCEAKCPYCGAVFVLAD